MTTSPAATGPAAAGQHLAAIAAVLAGHPGWSAFYDKRYRLWRTAEDDPNSDLYAETSDPDAIIAYITSHA